MTNARILIAEDEWITAHHIRRHLDRLGHEVVAMVDTGEDAIEKASELLPCLVLMDIKLAGSLDGVEAANRIRQKLGVPVVFLTAFADEETIERAKSSEPLGYLLKPFEPEELRTAIEIALSRKNMEAKLRASEARYRAVSELSSDFAYCFEVQPDGTVQCEWITDAFHRISGHDIDALRQAGDWREIIVPEDRDLYDQRLDSLLSGMPDVRVYRIRTQTGENRWIRDSARAEWHPEERRVHRIIGAAQDITAQKEIEEQLRQERTLYGALFENIPIQTVVVNRDGRIIAYNKAKEESGDRIPPVGGIMYRDYAARHTIDMHAEMMGALRDNSRREYPELPYGTSWLSIAITPFEQGAIITTEDITLIKQAEKERREYEARLRHAEKLESLGVMAGGIAHDFNNLLMAVLGNAELALMDLPEDAPIRASIQAIENAARKAAELSTQMLAYSGKGRLRFRPTDIDEICRETVASLAKSRPDGLHLVLDLHGDLPEVAGDSHQIRQALSNLISNSIEAVGAHEGTVSVRTGLVTRPAEGRRRLETVTELPDGKYVEITVHDTGGGIDPAHVERVFDPFFTTRFTGRGLGLAAALGIVRAHGGSIAMDNRPGEGLVVHMLLSCDEPKSVEPDKPSPPAITQSDRTVLVVDDEDSVRQVARNLLERAGYGVVTAADGIEALQALQKDKPSIHCVLLDLTMPRLGGAAAFQRLREVAPHVPVVLSSGYSVEEATRRFNREELGGFIQKPYQSECLLDTIARALS